VAFERLVVRHHASMAKVAYAVCGDTEVARDAVQAAWAIAWRRLPSLRDHGQVRAWLIAIAANEARQSVRRARRHVVMDISPSMDVADEADPADRIGIVDLGRALARMKPDDRALLAMRFVAGLDSTEIAAQLHLSPSGVRSRLARLIERLRTELDHA
jgi:RNA polymerase sigma-70 factor (ECF subfamily)